MEAWFRKGIGITSAANAVSNWANQAVSGAARDLAQATGAAQPTLQAGGTILLDGTSDFLGPVAFTLNQPTTVYLRARQLTWTSGDRWFDGTTVNSGIIFQAGVTPDLNAYAGNTGVVNTLALNTWGSIAVVYNAASSVFQVGGGSTVTGQAGPGNMGGIILGADSSGANNGNIEVAEMIVYSAAHDAAQRAAVIAYLNTL